MASANGHPDFPIQNLPLGVFSPPGGGAPRAGVAIGDMILDLAAAQAAGLLAGEAARAVEAAAGGILNPLFAAGAGPRRALRARLSELLTEGSAEAQGLEGMLHRAAGCTMHLPAHIGDYTDFYVGIHHATNVGKLFRPDNPLLPNYKYVPIGYHGRASSVVPSGTPIRRPNGQRKLPDRASAELRPVRAAGLRAGARRLDRPRQRARRADPDRRGGRAYRRLLPAERLVGPRHPGLGVPAARPVLVQEFRFHRLAVGHHARGARPLPHGAATAAGGRPSAASLPEDETDEREGGLDLELEVLLLTPGLKEKGLPPAPAQLEQHAAHVLDGGADGCAPHL